MDLQHISAIFFITLILYFIVNSTVWDKYILRDINSNMINDIGGKSNLGVLMTGFIYSMVMTGTYGAFSCIKNTTESSS
jgi:hypothetical protein